VGSCDVHRRGGSVDVIVEQPGERSLAVVGIIDPCDELPGVGPEQVMGLITPTTVTAHQVSAH
jgi:hypothetical protein